jgi:hypothetical protein
LIFSTITNWSLNISTHSHIIDIVNVISNFSYVVIFDYYVVYLLLLLYDVHDIVHFLLLMVLAHLRQIVHPVLVGRQQIISEIKLGLVDFRLLSGLFVILFNVSWLFGGTDLVDVDSLLQHFLFVDLEVVYGASVFVQDVHVLELLLSRGALVSFFPFGLGVINLLVLFGFFPVRIISFVLLLLGLIIFLESVELQNIGVIVFGEGSYFDVNHASVHGHQRASITIETHAEDNAPDSLELIDEHLGLGGFGLLLAGTPLNKNDVELLVDVGISVICLETGKIGVILHRLLSVFEIVCQVQHHLTALAKHFHDPVQARSGFVVFLVICS